MHKSLKQTLPAHQLVYSRADIQQQLATGASNR